MPTKHRTGGSRPPASKKSFRVGDQVAIKPSLSHRFPPAYAEKAFTVRKILTHADDPVEIDPGERYYVLEGVSMSMAEGFLMRAPADRPVYVPAPVASRLTPPPVATPLSRWARTKKWVKHKFRMA